MYCRECGKQVERADKFCYSCGSKAAAQEDQEDNKDPGSQGRKRYWKGITPTNLSVVGAFLLLALVTVGGLTLLIMIPPASVSGAIRIEKVRGVDTGIATCRDCSSITVGGDEFPMSTTSPKGLRYHLLKLARESGDQSGVVSFFNEEKVNRLFDLSFDISGSVVALNKRDKERKAAELYTDIVMEKVREYLTKTEPILPNDTVQVHLYGPTLRDNPCNETLTFNYTGPKYEADFSYSTRLDSALIRVGKKLPATETRKDGVITIDDREKMFAEIQQFYLSNLEKDNWFCHSNTLLDEHLQHIAPPLDRVGESVERHYVITNDGAFALAGSYVTKDDYSALGFYTDGLRLFKKNRPLCTTKADSAAFIGMDLQGSYHYRDALLDFFSKVLSPCRVIIREF